MPLGNTFARSGQTAYRKGVLLSQNSAPSAGRDGEDTAPHEVFRGTRRWSEQSCGAECIGTRWAGASQKIGCLATACLFAAISCRRDGLSDTMTHLMTDVLPLAWDEHLQRCRDRHARRSPAYPECPQHRAAGLRMRSTRRQSLAVAGPTRVCHFFVFSRHVDRLTCAGGPLRGMIMPALA